MHLRLPTSPRALILAFMLPLSLCLGWAQERPGPPGPPRAFDRQQRPGPWDQDILVYRVTAGEAPQLLATFERAGVATVTRLLDSRLIAAHQHFPEANEADFDKVAVRFSSDEGKTWSGPTVIRLKGLPEGMRFPFDPTLAALPDGRVRMYFTSLRGQRFEQATPAIYSAISSNGLDYVVEPGVRFGVEGRSVIDCAVALHNGVFHLYAPDNGTGGPPGGPPGSRGPDQRRPEDRPREGVGYHAISNDGLDFKRVEDVRIEGRRRWLGNAQSNGREITFYGTGEGGIWTATSTDGTTWSAPKTIGGTRVADPGAVSLQERSLLVVGTGPPRPGTPSAQRRGPDRRP